MRILRVERALDAIEANGVLNLVLQAEEAGRFGDVRP